MMLVRFYSLSVGCVMFRCFTCMRQVLESPGALHSKGTYQHTRLGALWHPSEQGTAVTKRKNHIFPLSTSYNYLHK